MRILAKAVWCARAVGFGMLFFVAILAYAIAGEHAGAKEKIA